MPPPIPEQDLRIKAFVALSKLKIKAIGEQPDVGPAAILFRMPDTFLVIQKYTRPDHTEFRVEFDVFGRDLTYRNKIPDGGTVTGINVSFGLEGGARDLAYTIRGLDLRADLAAALYFAPDPFDAFVALLTGDDSFLGSSEDDDLWGFAGRDLLRGRGGNDRLHGGRDDDIFDGGDGNDLLDGQHGIDAYRFSFAPNALTNFDTIKTFTAGETIYLSYKVFDEAGLKLNRSEFVEGPAALDGNDRLIWDQVQRTAFWDPDGDGAMGQTPIFKLASNAVLKFGDFQLYDF